MNYREQLNKINELNLNISDLQIAFEVSMFECKMSDEDFEDAAALIKQAWLKSTEVFIDELGSMLNRMLNYEKIPLDEITHQMLIDRTIDRRSD